MKNSRRGVIITAALLGLSGPAAHAQGCAQCRDNTAATPLRTQVGYRHAIELLALTAGGIFTAGVTILKRAS